MSREIKFRAWAKYGEMLPNLQNHIGNDTLAFGNMLNDNDFIVMQYTGLKDKNDVEIYESDIVRCVNGHIGTVEWKNNDCCFNVTGYYSPSNDYPTMAFMEGQPFEVMGNIYENQELLNDN